MNKYLTTTVLLILFLLLSECTPSPRYRANPEKSKTKPLSKTSVSHKKVIEGISSYYGEDFHGKLTANGEIFDMYAISAAHKTLPLNSLVKVTNLENGLSITLKINDRGPFIDGRILDCSYGAAKKLGFTTQGTTNVRIEVIEFGDDDYIKRN